MVETVSLEGRRRRRQEIVKEARKPAELLKKKGLGIVGRVRTGVATPRSLSRTDSEESERVARMGRHISLMDEFIQKLAKRDSRLGQVSADPHVCVTRVGQGLRSCDRPRS